MTSAPATIESSEVAAYPLLGEEPLGHVDQRPLGRRGVLLAAARPGHGHAGHQLGDRGLAHGPGSLIPTVGMGVSRITRPNGCIPSVWSHTVSTYSRYVPTGTCRYSRRRTHDLDVLPPPREILRDVIATADRRRDGRLPLDVAGVAETFGDELTLLGALQLRWHTRLARPSIEREQLTGRRPSSRRTLRDDAVGLGATCCARRPASCPASAAAILDYASGPARRPARRPSVRRPSTWRKAAAKEHVLLAIDGRRRRALEPTGRRRGAPSSGLERRAIARRRHVQQAPPRRTPAIRLRDLSMPHRDQGL